MNLDHDIVTGKKSVAEARKAFGDIVVQDVMGKHPAYVEALQFQFAAKSTARFPDEPVIPGSPQRSAKDTSAVTDAEVLAFVIAIDDNEILAAAEAGKKKVGPEVLEYANTLHTEHGKNLGETMTLGQKLDVTPIDTAAVDKLRVKGAGQLAELVPLEGQEFANAYLKAMVAGHTEALEMIDTKLLKTAKNDAVNRYHFAGFFAASAEKAATYCP